MLVEKMQHIFHTKFEDFTTTRSFIIVHFFRPTFEATWRLLSTFDP